MATCRTKTRNVILAALTGLAAAVGFTSMASGQNAVRVADEPAASTDVGPNLFTVKPGRNPADEKFALATDAPAFPVNRGSPPFPGGGCQLAANTNGFNYTSTAFLIADNFNAAANGTITGVSWSAVYRSGTAAPFGVGTPPATETFRIRFYNDAAGVPGTQIGADILVSNPTRTNSGTTLPNGTGTPLPIWDYTTAIAGPNVTIGTCYWLEIRNTSTLVAPTNVSFWVTASAVPGDTISMIDDSPRDFAGCGGYDAADAVGGDLTFCLSIPLNNLDGANCPIATLPPACAHPTANGTGLASASGVGFNAASPGSVYPGTITGVFQRADQFTPSVSGNINSVCFWGFFGQSVAGTPINSCERNFDIIVWNNDPATGQPSTVRGSVTVGTTAGVTLSRTIDAGGNEVFTVNLPVANQIAVTANTCYHLTVSAIFNTSVNSRAARWFWGTTPATVSGGIYDNTFWSRAIPSAGTAGVWQLTTAADNRFNLSYLINVGPIVASNCLPPPPGNDTCATATTLPLTGAVVNGSNVNATHEDLPGTAFDIPDGPTVWYTFVGTGNDVTVTTCNATSPLDSVLFVYCADTCAGPFNRVAGNDDDATPCGSNANASRVTFGTVNGQRYYVVVGGFNATQNAFQISATQGAASVNPPTCASLAACSLTTDPFDVQETDACGTGTSDTNNTCATATMVYTTLGQVAKGSVGTASGTGGTRDIDIWRLPASANGQTVSIFFRGENPMLIQVLNDASGTCATAFTVVAGSSLAIAACLPITTQIVDVLLPTTGNNYFLVTTPSFGGSTCAQGFDEYRFRIEVAVQGACCLDLMTGCFPTTLTDCANQAGGNPNAFWTANVPCTPEPCLSAPGKCCFPDQTCQLVPSVAVGNSTVCASQGGTYTADGVCSPNTCMSASLIACCQGATCAVIAPGACTGPNTLNSMASMCNANGNFTTPCCKADYNHIGGVTVQDIFDFLAGYFTNNPFADVNGSGISVQDIFDYLAIYFVGCP